MKRVLRVGCLLFILGVVSTIALGWYVRSEVYTPVSHNKADIYIDIPRGSTPYQILEQIQSEGILNHSIPLLIYARVTGAASRLKAGQYRFPSPITPVTVLHKLIEGEQRLERFTVIEGWTRWDVADAMFHISELHLKNQAEALALMNDISSIREFAPDAKNLEGYLFPDTYTFPPNASPEQVIIGMVKRFKQEWRPEWNEKASDLGMTQNEIVIIASLVETEAKLKDDRPIIASVIYNRIKRGMPLGIDSTAIYASKIAGTWRNDGKVYKSDVERQSPYNTRLNAGLPPGPVGSPGASALTAALNPSTTDYLYYVRDPSRNDGAHKFFSKEADFEKAVQALRDWEKARDTRANSAASPSTPTQ